MPELLDIDPRILLIDVNVRGDARPDPELVDSIRDVGVLQPVTAVGPGTGSTGSATGSAAPWPRSKPTRSRCR